MKKTISIFFLILVFLLSAVPSFAEEESSYATGWQYIDDAWYWFDEDGVPCTGWIKPRSAWYYLDEDGRMVTGWLKWNQKWYYLNPSSGAMTEGWLWWNNGWYYLCPGSGAMAHSGWYTIDGKRYCFFDGGKWNQNAELWKLTSIIDKATANAGWYVSVFNGNLSQATIDKLNADMLALWNAGAGFHITPGDHGTHVAGIIGATNNNGEGISSIAGGRDGSGGVKILSCAIMMDDPEKPDETLSGNIPDAIVWAADHGAVIANNSWSFVYDSEEEALQGDATYVEPAINYFIKNAGCDLSGKQAPGSPMKGGVLIFAAGNESYRIGWPAALESVIAVGALNSMYQPAYYTNYGDWVDICAPGGDLKLGPGILSTLSDSKYGSLQGTSMACPHVAGVAALIASHFGGPGFTADMLKERLLEGANKSKAPKNIGPIVDALGSFAYGGTIDPDPVANLTADVSANTVTLTWNVSADEDDVKALGYLMLLSRDREILETVKPRRTIPLSISQKKVENGTARIGETVSGMFDKLDFETDYYITVFAYDYLGHYSPLSDIITVRTGVNNPPVIERIDTGEFVVKAFEKKSIRFDVYDPDSHLVTVSCKPGSDALSIAKEGRTVKAMVTGIDAPAGVYDAILTATDEFGASASVSFSYRILENHPPQLLKHPDNIMFDSVGETVTLYIPDYITDEDEEPLTYAMESSAPKIAEVTPNGDHVKIRAAGYGLASVTITGTDISGSSSTLTFKVLVRDASRPVELYPNPVKTKLYLRTLEEGMLETTISNRAGATVYSGSAESTPFEPVEIDMTGMPSGTYYVRLKGCGLDARYTIVKI